MPRAQRTLYTIGHSTRTAEELIEILHAWKVRRLVDIRTIPRSRTNPAFNSDVLPDTLRAAKIAYTALPALGGRRPKSKTVPADVNAGWRVRAFHNYADYALTGSFAIGLRELLDLAAHEPCAMMCAEAVWWRCHRRIVADYALARGVRVMHLFSVEKAEPASLTPFAHVGDDGSVRYPSTSEDAD